MYGEYVDAILSIACFLLKRKEEIVHSPNVTSSVKLIWHLQTKV